MLKALFLADHNVSHTHDTFYQAMCKVLGYQFVHSYPCWPKYHTNHLVPGDQYSWWCYYDNKHILSLTIEGWAQEINEGKIKYIFCSNRGDCIDNLSKLISLINQEIFSKICITFIEEEHDLGFELHRANVARLMPIWDKIDIYYRMDYVKNSVASYDKIQPLYIAAPEEKLLAEVKTIKSFNERQYDVCYMTGASHPNRKIYYDILSKDLKFGNNIICWGNHQYSLHDYFNIINNSKIFISVRGNEYHNTRNIEGPYLGAALFTEQLPIEMGYDYINNESCVVFNKNTLIPLLNEYLNDKSKLELLAKTSKEHCMKYHTGTARANQFLHLAKKIKQW